MNKCYIQENNLKQIILKSSNVDIIGSYIRTWIDREGAPFKYEFKIQEEPPLYYNPDDLVIKRKKFKERILSCLKN